MRSELQVQSEANLIMWILSSHWRSLIANKWNNFPLFVAPFKIHWLQFRDVHKQHCIKCTCLLEDSVWIHTLKLNTMIYRARNTLDRVTNKKPLESTVQMLSFDCLIFMKDIHYRHSTIKSIMFSCKEHCMLQMAAPINQLHYWQT